jgi:ribonuclease BN (tRNA processing enzyme)
MGDVTLRFVGCGDAFAAGGRFQTSFYVEGGVEALLIDCGATTLVALKRLGIDPDTIGVVVLSHLHGDLFGGLPWLILDGQFAGRTKPLVIAGPERTEERFRRAFEVLYPGAQEGGWTFEVRVVELPEREPCAIGPAVVTTFPVIHTPCTFPHAVRIEYADRVIAFSGDMFGGTASLLGTIASAFGIAQGQSILEFFLEGTKGKVAILSLIIIVLMIRPKGLFPSKVRAA